MGHWTPTGVESKDYDDDDDDDQDLKGNTPVHRQPAQFRACVHGTACDCVYIKT